jgi:hypothetical protein
MTTVKSRRVRPPRFKVFQRTETELTHASTRHQQRQKKCRLPQRYRMRARSQRRRTWLYLRPTYQKAKPQALLVQPPRLNRLGIMRVIEVAKVVHEDQDNEEALVPPVEGTRESLGIGVRIVVRDATGQMDLHRDAMCETGRDRDGKGMMGLVLGVVVVRLREVIEEMIVGKAIDRAVGVVEEAHRWKAIEENPSVIVPVAAGVRIEGSRIVIDQAVVVEVKIEENRIAIDPVAEVEEGKVPWKSEGTIGGAIQEAGVTVGDRNSSVRYANLLKLKHES